MKKGMEVRNPALNEFVYNALFNASLEEKRSLGAYYRKVAAKDKAAQKFAATSSKDEKEAVLAALGYRFFYFIVRKNQTYEALKSVLGVFYKGKKQPDLDKVTEEGIFVSSDLEFTRAAGYAAMEMGRPSRFTNLQRARQGYHIAKWRTRLTDREDLEAREAESSGMAITKMLLNFSNSVRHYNAEEKLSLSQIQALLFLHLRRGETSEAEIAGYLVGHIRKIELTLALRQLQIKGFAIPLGKASDRAWEITSLGVKKVQAIFDRITVH